MIMVGRAECGGDSGEVGWRPGMSIRAQAASRKVLTVTRSCRACGPYGGQKLKAPLPSYVCQAPTLQGLPSCSAPVSSTAVTRKHGVITGQDPPVTHGCPETEDLAGRDGEAEAVERDHRSVT